MEEGKGGKLRAEQVEGRGRNDGRSDMTSSSPARGSEANPAARSVGWSARPFSPLFLLPSSNDLSSPAATAMVVESSLRPADSTSARPSQKHAAASSSPAPPPQPVVDSGIRNPPCPLFDIIQYACQPHFNYSKTTGERIPGGSVTCYPLPRVFRKCVPRPAAGGPCVELAIGPSRPERSPPLTLLLPCLSPVHSGALACPRSMSASSSTRTTASCR